MTSGKRRENGFSLLEVLVAFAVTSLLFGAILPAAVSSVDRIEDVRLRADALALAQTTLEKYAAIARFEEGVFDGRRGDLTWRTSISRLQPASQAEPTSPFALRQIRVEVWMAEGLPLITVAIYQLGEVR